MQVGVDYFIEKLHSEHQTSRFSMGPDASLRPLKSFIQNNALDFQTSNVAVTYAAIVPPAENDPQARKRIIGYVTLTCSEIDLDGAYPLEDCEAANRYQSISALKVARLATHAAYVGHQIGKTLMEFAIALAVHQVAQFVGCRFLVTDSKANSVGFYQNKLGFTLLDTEENRNREHPVMFLDLNKLDLSAPSDALDEPAGSTQEAEPA
ncbi:GNAT family N-acetyltransferase [Pseudomonas sp. NPDC096950]|uniref:GNAT family N-acetyltransferase n=1 Tax=Pseudomonas sp. NPDC096950 TaxID=3364485 RepID=UPI00383A3168